MGSDSYTLATIKTHGLAVGDRFNFHGLASDAMPTPEGTRVELGKVGTKYIITTVVGDVHTWEFGPSAKVWADTSVTHHGTDKTLAPPVLTDADVIAHGMDAGDIAEYNTQAAAEGDVYDAMVATAQDAILANKRVFVAEAHNFGGQAAFDALVASGWAYLINDGDMSRYVYSRDIPTPTVDDVAAMTGDPVGWVESLIGETVVGKRAWGPNGLQGTIESTYSDGSVNLVTFGKSNIIPAGRWKLTRDLPGEVTPTDPNQVSAPDIEGFYWMRHNGHMSVENGPTINVTDTYQLVRQGTELGVVATISHASGFRWVPSGCWYISTLLCESWAGVSLADAFERIKTYVTECQDARARERHDRMDAGSSARAGRPFVSRDDIRAQVVTAIEASGEVARANNEFDVDRVVDTIVAYYGRVNIDEVPGVEFWAAVQRAARPAPLPSVVAVGSLKTPVRTLMGKRARKALSRKHKPSKARSVKGGK